MSATPQTEAGRALLQALKFRWRTHILAIEAEATAALPLDAIREAIAAALEATLGPPADGISTAYRRAIVDYAIARLASADEESPEQRRIRNAPELSEEGMTR